MKENINIRKFILFIENHGKTQGIDINNNSFTFSSCIHQLLHQACLSNGMTKKGTVDAIRFHLNIKQKCPVMISVKNKIVFFPLTLAQDNTVIWMQYFPSMSIKRMNDYQTKCSFLNHTITLDVNHRSVKRQVKRCVQYIDILTANELEWDCYKTTTINTKQILEERIKEGI